MKTIKIKYSADIPKNFSGITEYADGTIEYRLNGEYHRLDGPAYIEPDDYKEYWINGKIICDSYDKNHEQMFYNSKEYKQWMLLENM